MKGLLLLLLIALGCSRGNKAIEKEALVRQGWMNDFAGTL